MYCYLSIKIPNIGTIFPFLFLLDFLQLAHNVAHGLPHKHELLASPVHHIDSPNGILDKQAIANHILYYNFLKCLQCITTIYKHICTI